MRKNRQNNDHVIIAIPLTEGHPSRFLGRCDRLAIFEVDKRNKKILYQSVHQAPPHEPGLLPSRLDYLGIDELLLTGEMGPLAERLLRQHGIGVVMNIPPKACEQIVWDYLNGEVTSTVGGGYLDDD
jgi:predicted Fe-Mo cluster-binding NifX family protein